MWKLVFFFLAQVDASPRIVTELLIFPLIHDYNLWVS